MKGLNVYVVSEAKHMDRIWKILNRQDPTAILDAIRVVVALIPEVTASVPEVVALVPQVKKQQAQDKIQKLAETTTLLAKMVEGLDALMKRGEPLPAQWRAKT